MGRDSIHLKAEGKAISVGVVSALPPLLWRGGPNTVEKKIQLVTQVLLQIDWAENLSCQFVGTERCVKIHFPSALTALSMDTVGICKSF